MKTRNYFNLRINNNVLLSNILPKIRSSSKILNTSPNVNILKKMKNKINKSSSPNKLYMTSFDKSTKNKRYKINNTIDIINKLSLDSNIRDIYMDELKKEKRREIINSNQEIIERRLGLYKTIEIDIEEEKNKEKDIKYYNEITFEKLNEKEKEKRAETNYKQSIKDLEDLEKKISDYNIQITDLMDNIEGKKLEMNVIDEFGVNIDKKNVALEKPIRLSVRNQTKKISSIYKKASSVKKNERRFSVVKKQDFEMQAKLLVKKYQRDEKQKRIKIEVNDNLQRLERLQNEREDLKEKYLNKKKEISIFKKELINLYHSKLYEGLDFKGEGLCKIIINIWKLGENIDIGFMPPFLDKDAINYLFKKSRQLIELSKIRKSMIETQKDFIGALKIWKKENNIYDSDKNNSNLEKNYFFQTNINDITYNSFLDFYPITKIFMNNYKSCHKNDSEKDEIIKVTHINYKSYHIPKLILEKNQKLEKIKNLYQSLKKEMEIDEKNEILRLTKEFLLNNYEEKNKVCMDTIIGALFGDKHKDDMLNLVDIFKKENKDNLKKIEFYSTLKNRIKKGEK